MENTPFFQNGTKRLLHMAQAADAPHPFSEAEVPARLLQEVGLPPRVSRRLQEHVAGESHLLSRTPTHDK